MFPDRSDRPGRLDAIDGQIIVELTRNARIPLAELAQRVILSRNAVRQRINRLERDGQIRGYTIIRGRPDEDVVRATVLIYRKDRMRGGDVIAELKQIPEIVRCDVLSGEFDLMALVEAASLERVQEIWHHVAELSGVRDTVTALSLSQIVDRSWQ